MKRLNLSALREITVDQAALFLSWLHMAGETVTLKKMQMFAPLRPSKLNFMLRLTKDFSFVTYTDEEASLTLSGLKFLKAEFSEQMRMLRYVLISYPHVQEVVQAIESSENGRLHKRLIEEMFSKGNCFVPKSEVSGFIAWAQACELLNYDNLRQEMFFRDPHLPARQSNVAET